MAVRTQNGNILLVLLFSMGALLFLGGVYLIYSGEGERKPAADPMLVMNELKERVEGALTNPTAVDASVARNPNQFACMFSVAAACRGYGGVFVLYESATSQPVSQLMKNSGISFDGAGCTGFPSEGCPFRVETAWAPVCAPGNCESTKSIRIGAKVYYDAGAGKPEVWKKDAMFTPTLKLSQGVVCERGGGVWAVTECLTSEQAAQRKIASSLGRESREPPREGVQQTRDNYDRAREEAPSAPMEQPEYICPDTIVVQGQFYTLEYLAPGRGQVHVPALNGCPAEDVFIFQCTAKSPATFEGEGQWVQVEAVMAPNCDEAGRPLGPGVRN